MCVEIIVSEQFIHKLLDMGDKVSTRQVSELLAAWPSSLPDLLPPLESRRLLAESERKVAAMRETLETIRRTHENPIPSPTWRVAKNALEATE